MGANDARVLREMDKCSAQFTQAEKAALNVKLQSTIENVCSVTVMSGGSLESPKSSKMKKKKIRHSGQMNEDIRKSLLEAGMDPKVQEADFEVDLASFKEPQHQQFKEPTKAKAKGKPVVRRKKIFESGAMDTDFRKMLLEAGMNPNIDEADIEFEIESIKEAVDKMLHGSTEKAINVPPDNPDMSRHSDESAYEQPHKAVSGQQQPPVNANKQQQPRKQMQRAPSGPAHKQAYDGPPQPNVLPPPVGAPSHLGHHDPRERIKDLLFPGVKPGGNVNSIFQDVLMNRKIGGPIQGISPQDSEISQDVKPAPQNTPSATKPPVTMSKGTQPDLRNAVPLPTGNKLPVASGTTNMNKPAPNNAVATPVAVPTGNKPAVAPPVAVSTGHKHAVVGSAAVSTPNSKATHPTVSNQKHAPSGNSNLPPAGPVSKHPHAVAPVNNNKAPQGVFNKNAAAPSVVVSNSKKPTITGLMGNKNIAATITNSPISQSNPAGATTPTGVSKSGQPGSNNVGLAAISIPNINAAIGNRISGPTAGSADIAAIIGSISNFGTSPLESQILKNINLTPNDAVSSSVAVSSGNKPVIAVSSSTSTQDGKSTTSLISAPGSESPDKKAPIQVPSSGGGTKTVHESSPISITQKTIEQQGLMDPAFKKSLVQAGLDPRTKESKLQLEVTSVKRKMLAPGEQDTGGFSEQDANNGFNFGSLNSGQDMNFDQMTNDAFGMPQFRKKRAIPNQGLQGTDNNGDKLKLHLFQECMKQIVNFFN